MKSDAFTLFSTAHFAVLAGIMAITLLFVWISRAAASRSRNALIARWLGVALAVVEVAWYVDIVSAGDFDPETTLPLHLSDVSIWVLILALITRKQLFYEWSYFFGIGGAIQALVTPNLHFFSLKFFISHGAIFGGVALLTLGLGMRPVLASIWRMIIAGNLYLLIVGLVNWLLGSNYGYIARKPDTPSLLDFLGPWPSYLIWVEAIAIALMGMLYLPFAIHDARARRRIENPPSAEPEPHDQENK